MNFIKYAKNNLYLRIKENYDTHVASKNIFNENHW